MQLIDAANRQTPYGRHSFDCDMSGVLAVQDDVTRKIVVTLVAHINRSEIDRVLRGTPRGSPAYDHCLRGNALMREVRQSPQADKLAAARAHYEAAAAIDEGFAPAFLGLAETYFSGWWSHRQRMHDAAEHRDFSIVPWRWLKRPSSLILLRQKRMRCLVGCCIGMIAGPRVWRNTDARSNSILTSPMAATAVA